MSEETISCAQVMARVLKEEGVEYLFGVGGRVLTKRSPERQLFFACPVSYTFP